MIDFSVKEIAEFVAGELKGQAQIQITGSVETDSRLCGPGSLFVAKPGVFTDGHEFIASAIERGAVAVIVERFIQGVSVPQIKVADSVSALGLLAMNVLSVIRAKTNLKVIGITGSNGKTTTKNMLKAILSRVGETIAPIESYNNEVGAPYSILQVTEKTKYLVVELGAGGFGTIKYLANISKPDIGVVLKVGLAHVGEFGSIENTAKIKSELVESLAPGAIAILNYDDGYVRAMAEKTKAKTLWFGTAAESDFRADAQAVSVNGTHFNLSWPDGQVSSVSLQILGEHHVLNALAAAAAAHTLGVSKSEIVAALEQMPLAERWRMETFHRGDGVIVINDAYNASPDSMKAALQTLAQIGRDKYRTIAILGEMAELGDFSRQEHDAIGRVAVRLNIDQLVVVGEGAKLIHMGAEQEGSWGGESKFFSEIDQALAYLRGMLRAGDLVLVKSSNSANLRKLGDDLVEEVS
jgi:UDP-N-acetylmuramoyl-tripeptide--D-alanyl-D-alanine ligase